EELYGRRLQLKSSVIGLGVAVIVVAFAHQSFFAQGLIPPVDRVFAATIKAGLDSSAGLQLALWAIPGALIQFIGGPKRQLGIMLASGLIILNPMAGWAVAVGVIIRFLILKVKGPAAEDTMVTMAAGFIAGDALYSFFSSLWKVK
ncbi:MAG: OPT/YSL family transporter, partial [Pseudomonas graminis]